MKRKSLWSEIKFMLLLSLVCSLLLGGTNLAIGKRSELSEETITAIFSITKIPFEQKSIYEEFESKFEQQSKGRIKLWMHKNNSSIVACEATGGGMWGEITIVFVLNKSDNQILGLKVTEQKETAGLGSKISEEDFEKQFTDKSIQNHVTVDAITGATTSSRYVEKLLNKALEKIRD